MKLGNTVTTFSILAVVVSGMAQAADTAATSVDPAVVSAAGAAAQNTIVQSVGPADAGIPGPVSVSGEGVLDKTDPKNLSPMELEAKYGKYRKEYRNWVASTNITAVKEAKQAELIKEREKKLAEANSHATAFIDAENAARTEWNKAKNAEELAEAALGKKKEELKAAEDKLHAYEKDIDDEMKNLQAKKTVKKAHGETATETVHDRYLRADKARKDAKTSLFKAKDNVKNAEAEISALKADKEKAGEDLKTAKSALDAAAATEKTASDAYEAAKKAVKDADKAVDDAKADVGTAKDAVSTAKKNLGKAEDALDDLKSDVKKAETKLAKAKAAAEKDNTKEPLVSEAQSALNAKNAELPDAERNLAGCKSALTAAENTLGEKNEALKNAKEALRAASQREDAAEDDYDAKHDAAEDARDAVKDAEEYCADLENALKKALEKKTSGETAVKTEEEGVKKAEEIFKVAEEAAEAEWKGQESSDKQLVPLRAAALRAEEAVAFAKGKCNEAGAVTDAAWEKFAEAKKNAKSAHDAITRYQRYLDLAPHDAQEFAETKYNEGEKDRLAAREAKINAEIEKRVQGSSVLKERRELLKRFQADVVSAKKELGEKQGAWSLATNAVAKCDGNLSALKKTKPNRNAITNDVEFAKASKAFDDKINSARTALDNAKNERVTADKALDKAKSDLADAERRVRNIEKTEEDAIKDERKIAKVKVLAEMRHQENLEIAQWRKNFKEPPVPVYLMAARAAKNFKEAKKRYDEAEEKLDSCKQAVADAEKLEKDIKADNDKYGAARKAANQKIADAETRKKAALKAYDDAVKAEQVKTADAERIAVAAAGAVAAAEQALDGAKTELDNAKKELKAAKDDAKDAAAAKVRTAESKLAEAEKALDRAKNDYKTKKAAQKAAYAAQKNVDDSAVSAAEKELNAAKKELARIPSDRRFQEAAQLSDAQKPTAKANAALKSAQDEYDRADEAFTAARKEYRKFWSPTYTTKNYSGAKADEIVADVERALGCKFVGDRRWLARTIVDGRPLVKEFKSERRRTLEESAKEAAEQAIDAGFYLAGFTVRTNNVVLVDKGRFGPFSVQFLDKDDNVIWEAVDDDSGSEDQENGEDAAKSYVSKGRFFTEEQIKAKIQGKDRAVREGAAFNFNVISERFKKLNGHPDIEKADINFDLPTDTFHYDYNGTNYVNDVPVFDESFVEDPVCAESNTRALATTIVVKEKPRRWHYIAEVDNFGSMSSADKEGVSEADSWLARFTVQNLNLWDSEHALTLSGNMSLGGSLYGGTVGYTIPQESFSDLFNVTLHGGYTGVSQDDVVPDVDVDGTGYYGGVLFSRRLYDSGKRTLDINAGFTYRYVETSMTVEGYELEMNNGDGYTIMPLSLALTWADSQLDEFNGRTYVTLEGVYNLGGSALDELQNFRRAIEDDKYLLAHFQLARLQLLPDWLLLHPVYWLMNCFNGEEADQGGPMLFTKLDSQWSNGPLIGAEQFGLGGHSTVRGYAEREFMGDQGFSATFELRSPIVLGMFNERGKGMHSANRWQYVMFWDLGWFNLEEGLGSGRDDSEFISGIGVGFRYAYKENFQLRLDWGFPLITDDTQFETSSAGVGSISAQLSF